MFKNKVGRPSNEVIKKRRILKALALSIVFIAILSLTYTLTNINTKRLKGESDYPEYLNLSCEEGTACYQVGFRNGNLYQKVIDSYNDENNASLSYEDVITDEQLLSITILYAPGRDIDDVTGIERLINLRYLDLSDNNLSSIDLSNTNLSYLSLAGNNITSIDLSNLTNLEELYLSNNNLSEIDLGNLIYLEELRLSNNNISEINLSNLTNLEDLRLSNNNLSSLDLSNNLNIEDLSLDIDLYNTIDYSNLNNLYRFRNNLTMLVGEQIDINNVLNIFGVQNSELYEEGEIYTYNNGIIRTINQGYSELCFYFENSKNYYIELFVFDPILSNKYEIDNENKYIYVGNETDEEIRENIILKYEGLCSGIDSIEDIEECMSYIEKYKYFYGVKINNSILKYQFYDDKEDQTIKYNLGRIDLSSYEVNENEITVSGVFNYEEVPHDNVELEYSNNTLIVKDLNGNEVDRYTVNVRKSNETPNSNDGDEINEVEESTTNNIATEKEDITSKKTTLNKFENNAKTYDDIVKYFIIGGIAIVLIIGVIIYTKKK